MENVVFKTHSLFVVYIVWRTFVVSSSIYFFGKLGKMVRDLFIYGANGPFG